MTAIRELPFINLISIELYKNKEVIHNEADNLLKITRTKGSNDKTSKGPRVQGAMFELLRDRTGDRTKEAARMAN